MESDEPSLELSEPPGGSTGYDRISRFYDSLSAPGEKRFTQRGLELLAPARGESVLEIGFGTGRALVALARAVGDSGRVYGIDISEGMMHVTQNRLDKAGLIGQVVLEQGHAAQLPFEPSFFDAIFMSFTLELFSEKAIPRVLAECKRVLKTDGRLGIVSMSESDPPTLAQRIYFWGHKSMPGIFDCRPIPLVRLLQKNGFAIQTQVEDRMGGIPVSMVVAHPVFHPEA